MILSFAHGPGHIFITSCVRQYCLIKALLATRKTICEDEEAAKWLDALVHDDFELLNHFNDFAHDG